MSVLDGIGEVLESGVEFVGDAFMAAEHTAEGVGNTFLTGVDVMIGGFDAALGNDEGAQQWFNAADKNADAALEDFGQAGDYAAEAGEDIYG